MLHNYQLPIIKNESKGQTELHNSFKAQHLKLPGLHHTLHFFLSSDALHCLRLCFIIQVKKRSPIHSNTGRVCLVAKNTSSVPKDAESLFLLRKEGCGGGSVCAWGGLAATCTTMTRSICAKSDSPSSPPPTPPLHFVFAASSEAVLALKGQETAAQTLDAAAVGSGVSQSQTL